MTTNTILLIAVPTLVVLAGLLVFASARRRDTGIATGVLSSETKTRDRGPIHPSADPSEEAPVTGREIELAATQERRGALVEAPSAPPVAWVPPDEEKVDVNRRQFFNRSLVTLMLLGTTGFGASTLGFLWYGASGGFGGRITLGRVDELQDRIEEGEGFAYFPEGRLWLTQFPSGALDKAEAVYSEPELVGMREGLIALYQKCPHLGCRVPECTTSQWFECPCHGSQYNQVGEKKGGPAPRGMDRFPLTVENGSVIADTGEEIEGPPIGTNTTGQEAEGPHCIGGASH